MAEGTMRLDLFLWFARIVKTRDLAQQMAASGRLRLNGRAVDKPAAPVRIGCILAFATPGGQVRALQIEALPTRRGPPDEARACYADLLEKGGAERVPGDANVDGAGARA